MAVIASLRNNRTSTGRDEAGYVVAVFQVVWSFKAK